MKKREFAIALLCLGAFLAVRGPALRAPFILPFETAFQEAIALHHLDNGLAANHYLPVFATINDENFYHTAHPPLLHIVYALAYKAVGVHEWVTRGISLGLYFLSVLLWRLLLGRRTKHGWFVFPIAFALPVSFLLCTTTNYELMSIFFISLIAWLGLVRRSGLVVLLAVVTVGMLVDWPVYLAVPALLAMRWREPKERMKFMMVFACEVVFFLALQVYQYRVAGEAAFFSHAPDRANPFALFSVTTWLDLGSHYLGVMGAPLALASGTAMAAWTVVALRSNKLERALFFAPFLLLLVVSAPRLVSLHYVYLLYFAPLAVIALQQLIARTELPKVALIALLLLCFSRDFILNPQRNPAYFGMADRLKSADVKTAYSEPAIGVWRYYNSTETVHPISIRGADWPKTNTPDLAQFKGRLEEVKGHSELIFSHDGFGGMKSFDYQYLFILTEEIVKVKKRIADFMPRYLVGMEPTFVMNGPGNDCPGGMWIQARPIYGHNVSDCKVSNYAIHQPPGTNGKEHAFKGASQQFEGAVNRFSVSPAIIHSLPTARSDGVTFMALVEYDKDSDNQSNKLVFARFVSGSGEVVPATDMDLNLKTKDVFKLITTPGIHGNAAFDDAYWIEPLIIRGKVEDEEH